MEKPTFSVIIPTLNEEGYLPYLLEDINNQTAKPQEIVVADAGSTDKTVRVAQRFGAIITEGGTPAVGRNNGVKALTTKVDYYFFIDADVRLPTKCTFEHILEELSANNIDIANPYIISAAVQPQEYGKLRALSGKLHEWWWIELGKMRQVRGLLGSFIIARRSVFNRIRFNPHIVYWEDRDFRLRAEAEGYTVHILTTPVYASIRRFKRGYYLKAATASIGAGIYKLALITPIKKIRHALVKLSYRISKVYLTPVE